MPIAWNVKWRPNGYGIPRRRVNSGMVFSTCFIVFFLSDLKQKVEEKQDPDNNDIVTL